MKKDWIVHKKKIKTQKMFKKLWKNLKNVEKNAEKIKKKKSGKIIEK